MFLEVSAQQNALFELENQFGHFIILVQDTQESRSRSDS